jgi:hypothetical protein
MRFISKSIRSDAFRASEETDAAQRRWFCTAGFGALVSGDQAGAASLVVFICKAEIDDIMLSRKKEGRSKCIAMTSTTAHETTDSDN